MLCPVYPFVDGRVRRHFYPFPLQRAAAYPPSTSCSPLPAQAAAAARIADKPDIIEAYQKEDLALLADHLMVDPTRARAKGVK